jgi:hypothetical protein
MCTPVARKGHAISWTPSPRSTLWRKRPRTDTSWALCHQSPSLWRGQGELMKTTVSSIIAENVFLNWRFVFHLDHKNV